MSHYTVEEAQDRLDELIDRVLAGERIIITRNGEPVAELGPARTGVAAAFGE
jgi:prevent-host-death family protein